MSASVDFNISDRLLVAEEGSVRDLLRAVSGRNATGRRTRYEHDTKFYEQIAIARGSVLLLMLRYGKHGQVGTTRIYVESSTAGSQRILANHKKREGNGYTPVGDELVSELTSFEIAEFKSTLQMALDKIARLGGTVPDDPEPAPADAPSATEGFAIAFKQEISGLIVEAMGDDIVTRQGRIKEVEKKILTVENALDEMRGQFEVLVDTTRARIKEGAL